MYVFYFFAVRNYFLACCASLDARVNGYSFFLYSEIDLLWSESGMEDFVKVWATFECCVVGNIPFMLLEAGRA